jgi:hypothetical protein
MTRDPGSPRHDGPAAQRGLLAALAAGVADSGTELTPFEMPWNLRPDAGEATAGRAKLRR